MRKQTRALLSIDEEATVEMPAVEAIVLTSSMPSAVSQDINSRPWYRETWKQVREWWAAERSVKTFASVYRFEDYAQDCQALQDQPHRHDAFKAWLDERQRHSQLAFERDIEADYLKGFKLPLWGQPRGDLMQAAWQKKVKAGHAPQAVNNVEEDQEVTLGMIRFVSKPSLGQTDRLQLND